MSQRALLRVLEVLQNLFRSPLDAWNLDRERPSGPAIRLLHDVDFMSYLDP